MYEISEGGMAIVYGGSLDIRGKGKMSTQMEIPHIAKLPLTHLALRRNFPGKNNRICKNLLK